MRIKPKTELVPCDECGKLVRSAPVTWVVCDDCAGVGGRKLHRDTRVALVRLAAWGVLLAGALALAAQPAPTPRLGVQAGPAPEPSVAEQLMGANECWTGEAPADVTVPGHVVATDAEGVTRLGGARLVDQALGQIFDGEQHGLTVHAFCK